MCVTQPASTQMKLSLMADVWSVMPSVVHVMAMLTTVQSANQDSTCMILAARLSVLMNGSLTLRANVHMLVSNAMQDLNSMRHKMDVCP